MSSRIDFPIPHRSPSLGGGGEEAFRLALAHFHASFSVDCLCQSESETSTEGAFQSLEEWETKAPVFVLSHIKVQCWYRWVQRPHKEFFMCHPRSPVPDSSAFVQFKDGLI